MKIPRAYAILGLTKKFILGEIIMPVYNKLVRDKIPKIIENSGKRCSTEMLDDENYVRALREKLHEEVAEYSEATTDENALEELADILELIHALTKVHGGNPERLESIRHEKALQRGAFENKVFLIEVED